MVGATQAETTASEAGVDGGGTDAQPDQAVTSDGSADSSDSPATDGTNATTESADPNAPPAAEGQDENSQTVDGTMDKPKEAIDR